MSSDIVRLGTRSSVVWCGVVWCGTIGIKDQDGGTFKGMLARIVLIDCLNILSVLECSWIFHSCTYHIIVSDCCLFLTSLCCCGSCYFVVP